MQAHRPAIATPCVWCGAEADDTWGIALCGNPLCDPARPRKIGRLHVATLKHEKPSIMISMLKKKGDASQRRPRYISVLGRVAAGYMLQNVDQFGAYDLVLPAPTHPDHVAERGYDITAGIHQVCAELVAPALPKSVVFDDLTPPVWDQVTSVSARGKNWKERQAAVKGAYRVRKEHRDYIKGKRILVIDDVYTTGLDFEEMASELLQTGAKAVDGLAVTRQIRVIDSDKESENA